MWYSGNDLLLGLLSGGRILKLVCEILPWRSRVLGGTRMETSSVLARFDATCVGCVLIGKLPVSVLRL